MKKSSPLFFAAILAAFAVTSLAHAQTQLQPPGTRNTPCDPNTPNDAICVVWAPVVTMSDGTPAVLAITYNVERKFGAGDYAPIRTAISITKAYDQKLAPGTYTYRVTAGCAGCTNSAPSNEAVRNATPALLQPAAPVLQVVQVTISSDRAPVYRVLGATSTSRGELYGFVPIGRECAGAPVFKYRGSSFYRVSVDPSELWGTKDSSNLAAPCSAGG